EAAPAVDERTPAARIVAVLWFLDLENLGAHVAEHHRAVRPGNDAGEIDHAHTVQWWHARDYVPKRKSGSQRWRNRARTRGSLASACTCCRSASVRSRG